MSVRAYKLIEIKTADDPTFNCWHDDAIVELADHLDNLTEGGGMLSFQKSVIQSALKDEHTAEERKILRQMLKDCGKNDFVEYYCF